MEAGNMPNHWVGFTPFFRLDEYLVDRCQRTILFWDVLRKRGNNYLAHVDAGMPPILAFSYEMVVDGRKFARPVNYAMVRICERRRNEAEPAEPAEPAPYGGERRKTTRNGEVVAAGGQLARPIVIIDPRAGHGPGIGGSKMDSQIGVALLAGHPVYFVLFFPDPEKDQTIADVQRAEVKFLEKVVELHPGAPRPAVIGNCQAGWAAALVGADRPDLTGPIILNGSPLSYWGGSEGRNPMRYRGGLYGGIWLTSLCCDLGNGRFDGAHLVAGFEDLNPANTFWTKYIHLFTHVDTEEKRYLDFEKWWGGFYRMNGAEIYFIVDSLFIGNELEQGRLRLDDGRLIDMKKFRSPVLAFASKGDNITPPPQALNWIKKVYGTVDEIKRCGQVIIYMVHEDVGHLGIFVSGSVARKEHKEILGNMGWLEYLQPGLYEMVIDEPPRRPGLDDWRVRFVEREMEDILKLDDGLADEQPFLPVHKVSRLNDAVYSCCLRPWIRLAASEPLAETIRLLHPLRMQRYLISDLNPWVLPVKMLAEQVRADRRRAEEDNPFAVMEKICAETLENSFNYFRDLRDQSQVYLFQSLYDNPLTAFFFGEQKKEDKGAEQVAESDSREGKREKEKLRKAAGEGGYVEACIRVMTAVAGVDRIIDVREFQAAEQIVQGDERLRALAPAEFKKIVREQARILAMAPRKAIGALGEMAISPRERLELLRIAETIARADEGVVENKEANILASLKQVLQNPGMGLSSRTKMSLT